MLALEPIKLAEPPMVEAKLTAKQKPFWINEKFKEKEKENKNNVHKIEKEKDE